MNTTVFNNVTSIMDVVQGLNTNVNYMIGDMILVAFFLICVVIFSSRVDIKETLVGASAGSLLVAILLWASHLLLPEHIWIPVVAFFAFTLVYLLSSK